MDLGINWYEAFSTESASASLAVCILIIVVLFLFSKRTLTQSLVSALVLIYFGFSIHSSGFHQMDELKEINESVLSIYESSEKFPLFPRSEVEYLFNEISKAQKDDFYYVGDLTSSSERFFLQNFFFMNEDQLSVYSKFIDHCYSPEIVSVIWSTKLSGYPVHSDEAKQALAFAEARTETVKPECLSTTASLTFLK